MGFRHFPSYIHSRHWAFSYSSMCEVHLFPGTETFRTICKLTSISCFPKCCYIHEEQSKWVHVIHLLVVFEELKREVLLVVSLYQFRQAKTAVTIVFYSENDLDNIPGLAVHSSVSKQGRKGQIALKLPLKIPAKYNLDNWIFYTITTGLEECQELTIASRS